MPIHFQNDRQGMTVYPDARDEATNEIIEGSAQVLDTLFANIAKEDEEVPTEVDDPSFDNQDHLSEEDRDPLYEVRLSDTEEDIRTSEYSVSEDFANEIAGADIGDSPSDITVKFLATKVFQGHMTPDEAFADAVGSGLSPDALMQSYWTLKEYFNN